MHLRMIYKYSFNRALHKLLVYVATAFLCFVVFALLLVSIFAWRFVRQGRTAVDACLNGGIEQAGMISIDTFGFEYEEAVDAFVQESSKMKEIRGTKSRCIPFEQEQEHVSDTCICCGKPAKTMVVWGIQY